jgi:hypothetical protein
MAMKVGSDEPLGPAYDVQPLALARLAVVLLFLRVIT